MINQLAMTAVIIAKNEELMLPGCINSLRWCQDILLIDNGSTDKTVELAEQLGARVIHFQHSSFAKLRNDAIKHVSTDWLIYLDADERVTPTLAKEIGVTIETKKITALSMKRKNIFFGQELKHGGWAMDQVTRGFHHSAAVEWYGDIHESPRYQGKSQVLKSELIHYSHRDVASGLMKSAAWTPIEAKLLAQSKIPPVTVRTVFRKGAGEFFRRVIKQQAYKDGQAGMMEAIIQAINRMLVYIQVWEKQQQPPIMERYQNYERELAQLWENES